MARMPSARTVSRTQGMKSGDAGGGWTRALRTYRECRPRASADSAQRVHRVAGASERPDDADRAERAGLGNEDRRAAPHRLRAPARRRSTVRTSAATASSMLPKQVSKYASDSP